MRTTNQTSEFPRTTASPAELLAAWSADSGNEPACFFRVGWEWRWWSVARLYRAVQRGDGGEQEGRLPELRALLQILDSRAATPAAVAAAAVLDARLAPLTSHRGLQRFLGAPEREIVLAAPVAGALGSALLGWWLARRAAWVLPPSERAFVDTVVFARPTRVVGSTEQLLALGKRLAGLSRWRRRRSSDRLRTFVVTDSVPAQDACVRLLGELGIEVLPGEV